MKNLKKLKQKIKRNKRWNQCKIRKKTTEKLTQFSKAMLKELKANGWKLYVEGKYNHTLTKGNLGCNIVVLNTGEIYSSGIMIFLKSRLSDEKTKKEQIKLCDQTIDELLNEE